MNILRKGSRGRVNRPRGRHRLHRMEHLENRLLLAADSFEPNDSFQEASNLGTGDQVHIGLSVDVAQNDDWYKWTASATGLLKVDVLFEHQGGDLDLQLYDSSQQLLEQSFTVSDNEHVQLEVVADRAYFIKVLGFFGSTQPDYALAINGPEPRADDFEPNDRLVDATVVPTGDRTLEMLSIHEPDNDDWFTWLAPLDGILTVQTRFDHDLGNLDLELWDASQTVIAGSSSLTDNEQVSIAVQAGQAYLVRVYGMDGDIHRSYDLVLNGPDILPDPLEPNDSFGQAHDLGTEDQVRAGLTMAGSSEDWFQWTSPAAGTLTVDVLFPHAFADLDLALYTDQSGFLVESTTDDDNEQVQWEVEAEESYFIRVFAMAGALHPGYTLAIDGPEPPIGQDLFEPNDTFDDAADLQGLDQTRTGLTIHAAGNDDWYKWTAFADGQLTVDALFDHALGDVNIELYDTSENLVVGSSSTTDNERFVASVAAGQKYVIRVFGAEGVVQRRYELVIDGPEILPDVFESNDSFDEAVDLGMREQTHEGLTIHEAGNHDWFRWSPARSGTLRVDARFRNELGDIELELYDANANLLDSSTTSSDVESVSWEVSAGQTYIVHVFAFGSFIQPDYTLVIDAPGPERDIFEPNDSRKTAANLSTGDQAHKGLTIHESENDDWFAWTTSVDGTMSADVLFSHLLGNVDLEIHDVGGQLVAASTSVTDNETLTLEVSAGQTYFLRVFGVDEAIQPSYSLVISSPGPNADSFEPNDSRDAATNLNTGDQSHTGLTIHGPGNEDWFRWKAAADGGLDVTLTFTHDEGDVNLELYNTSGTVVASSSSTDDDEFVSVSAVADQTYFIRVFGAGDDIQERYDLNIQANDPPTISSIDTQSTIEDQKIPAIPFNIGDAETSPQLLTVTATSSNPSLVPDNNLLFDGAGSARTLTISPVPNQSGQSTITVTVQDSEGGTTTQSFQLAVAATADVPNLIVSNATGGEDEAIPLNIVSSLNDTDGSETLSVQIGNVPPGVTLSQGINVGGGSWVLTADDLVGLTATPPLHDDADMLLSVVATSTEGANGDMANVAVNVAIAVQPVADAPMVTVTDVTGQEDTAIPLKISSLLLDNDGSESLTIAIRDVPDGAMLSAGNDNQDGSWSLRPEDLNQLTFVPPANGDGVFTLTVTATATEAANGDSASTERTTNVTVIPANDPPSISDLADQVTMEDTRSESSPFVISDPETDGSLLMVSVTSDNPTLVPNTNIIVQGTDSQRSLSVIPAANQSGIATITVVVSDGDGGTASDSFQLTVTSMNDRPVNSVPDPQTTLEDTGLTFATQTGNAISVRDPDAGSSLMAMVITADEGTLAMTPALGVVITGNRSDTVTLTGRIDAINTSLDGMTYTPRANFHGQDRLTIATSDLGHTGGGDPGTDTDFVTIQVTSVNDPPEITSSPNVTVTENTIDVTTVLAVDGDSDALHFTIDDGSDPGAFTIDRDTGTLRFRVAPDFESPADANGDNVYTVEVRVEDDGGAATSQQIVVTVTDADEIAPTVQIFEVRPDPRIGAIGEITIVFSEAVTGFDLSDLSLTRTTDAVVSLLPADATLTTDDNVTWTLRDIALLTGGSGRYALDIRTDGSGIQDAGGQPLADGATETWITKAGDSNEDAIFNQIDLIMVLQAGKYLTGEPATWSEGDWNGDGVFDQHDIILSRQTFAPGVLAATAPARVDAVFDEIGAVPRANKL